MDRYTILGELGRGAMGVVYRAQDTKENRLVALKVMDKQWRENETAVKRFQSEAKALSRLQHPGVIKIYDTGMLEGLPFFAMEFIEGKDLYTASREKQLPMDEVIGWMHQAADALVHVHEREMVHRDLKPANLLVDAKGRVIVMDFGLAKGHETVDLTVAGMVVGTMRFLPHEVFLGAASGPPRDVYSLAVTMHELLSGKSWCPATQIVDLMERVIRGPGPDLAADRPDAPKWLVALQAKALSSTPAQRPTMKQVRDSFAAHLKGQDPTKIFQVVNADGTMARPPWRERYVVQDPIGKGTTGPVYRAVQEGQAAPVAVKGYKLPQHAQNVLPRLRRELGMMKKLGHAGVVKVLDFAGEGEEPFVAMELVPGRPLDQQMAADSAGIRKEADRLFPQIAESVAALHAAGLTHANLKPQNVIRTPEGRPVVTEVALVKDLFGGWTVLQQGSAKPIQYAFLPPEMIQGEAATQASDVWMLGAIYYWLHTGETLFKTDSLEKMCQSIMDDPLPDFAAKLPHMSDARRALLAAMLARDPARRPEDGRRVLEQWVKAPAVNPPPVAAEAKRPPAPPPPAHGGPAKPAPAQSATPPPPAPTRAKTNLKQIAPLVAALIFAAAAVAVFVHTIRKKPAPTPSPSAAPRPRPSPSKR